MNPLAALVRSAAPDDRPDADLVAAAAGGDDRAFAELVRRHGPPVWSACRRLLPDRADAEDAFQATFLVLARRAAHLRDPAAVGPWLHAVAVRTARCARRGNARRLVRREPLPDDVPATGPDPAALADLDAALLALPPRHRAAVVLCHLHGLSRREAAARLGCPEGTLSSLLSRGLARLRRRLRGLDPAAVPVLAVPAGLAAGAARGAASPAAFRLAEGVLRMFWVKKATAAAAALVAVFGLGVGIGLSARTAPVVAAGDEKPAAKSAPAPPAANPADELKLAEVRLELAREALKWAEGRMLDGRIRDAGRHDWAIVEALQEQVARLEARCKVLREQAAGNRPAADEDLSVLDVVIGGKMVGTPWHVKEYDRAGKVIGGANIDPPAMLARYLARAKADPACPKTLRIIAWEDAPHDRIKAAYRACREAGFKTAVLHGRVPLDDPDITFTPPKDDPGGLRKGWFEADEVTVDLAKLVKPAPAAGKP
jgi:RNA polymerase sigma factor (sigma-70 family)